MSKQFAVGVVILSLLVVLVPGYAFGTVKVGLNYPKTGPYSVQGLDQWRAANLAVEEINAKGGIMGEPVEIVWRDSQSKPDVARANVTELIDKENVKMVFGGSSSGVAIAAAKVCHEKNVPFFGTLTYSTATTGQEGLRTTFRECYDSWMGAKAMGQYLKQNFPDKKYFYITADYTWGWTTESSVRKFTGTDNNSVHKGIKTPFPGATDADFKKALNFAKMVKPDVLVLVLFGNDMVTAIRQATAMGMKSDMQIVVPNLTLGMAEGGGPKVMEGVIGALPWCWQVPHKYTYPKGKSFVNNFTSKYNRYPSTSGASAYTILYEYKSAVERANSFSTDAVISALEGHKYTLLKDEQYWRDFDHQSVQTVYLVKCKPEAMVLKDKYKLDYFEIIGSIPGEQAVRSYNEWIAVRESTGKPKNLF
ncbi:MAG: ABC transporter substrate-binding protein [candidate division Zixibacteria bacterium]|nr:ABC transporter substrate-binding protein [candidate division Zixibacteria bacterium]